MTELLQFVLTDAGETSFLVLILFILIRLFLDGNINYKGKGLFLS
jgi:hypothetical protein